VGAGGHRLLGVPAHQPERAEIGDEGLRRAEVDVPIRHAGLDRGDRADLRAQHGLVDRALA
jgi:hypothetical protein